MRWPVFLVGAAFLGAFLLVTSQIVFKTDFSPLQSIPKGWKKLELNEFSFYAPPNMMGGKNQSTDSENWVFSNDNIKLAIDLGYYSNNLQIYSDQPDYHEDWLTIGGRKAKLCSFRLNDSFATSANEKLRFVTAAYFPDTRSGSRQLTVWANSDSSEGQKIAKAILHSIKFKSEIN